MQEFMLLIKNVGDGKANLSADQHLTFVKQCETYIGELKNKNQLIAAQPLIRQGAIISKNRNEWKIETINVGEKNQVGYYHILANDLNEAIEIAKRNPEFEFVESATIEVRPIKMKELQTNFVYPK